MVVTLVTVKEIPKTKKSENYKNKKKKKKNKNKKKNIILKSINPSPPKKFKKKMVKKYKNLKKSQKIVFFKKILNLF